MKYINNENNKLNFIKKSNIASSKYNETFEIYQHLLEFTLRRNKVVI